MIVDTREVTVLARDLDGAAGDVDREARKVVARGALNIKNDARRRVSGHGHLPAYPYSITYDLLAGVVGAEIGPDKRRNQGPLGNIIEYGGLREAPIPHMGPAADKEMPGFRDALEKLAERLVLR